MLLKVLSIDFPPIVFFNNFFFLPDLDGISTQLSAPCHNKFEYFKLLVFCLDFYSSFNLPSIDDQVLIASGFSSFLISKVLKLGSFADDLRIKIDWRVCFPCFVSPKEESDEGFIVFNFHDSIETYFILSGDRYLVNRPFFLLIDWIFLIDVDGIDIIMELDFLWQLFFLEHHHDECTIGVKSTQLSKNSTRSLKEFFERGIGHFDFQTNFYYDCGSIPI